MRQGAAGAKYSFGRAARYVRLRAVRRLRGLRQLMTTIDARLVVFEAFHGSAYACSPRALYEAMLSDERFKRYKFVWAFEDTAKYDYLTKNPRTRVVAYESRQYYQAYAHAKYWVVNAMLPLTIAKKPRKQIMLQCWHGTPLKRLRSDILDMTGEARDSMQDHLQRNQLDTRRYDYFISPSSYATEHFKTAFDLSSAGEQTILETGFPRNDYLVRCQAEEAAHIKQRLAVPLDKKVILYAPTWRDDQYDAEGYYVYNPPLDFQALQKALGEEYVVLLRLHYLVRDTLDISSYEGFLYDVSSADDINELYVISDVLVTDYSSVFFDYAILQRPMIFYMYDKEHYEHELRGLYLGAQELPGDIVTTQAELTTLLQNIQAYQDCRKEDLAAFRAKFNYLDDGNATSRVINAVWKNTQQSIR